MSTRRIWAIVRKEFREYRRSRSVIYGMAVLPLVFAVQPLIAVLRLSSGAVGGLAHEHVLLYMLGIPTLVPVFVAAYSVAGERQQGTLEPALTTPIRGEEFLIGKALAAIDADALGNIRLHFGDASELIDWVPAGSLARIDLLYPDPWPKRRHWKRRFIQDDSLARLARLLRVGGELRFATDIADYAAWALARVLRSKDFVWTAEVASDWRQPWPEFSGTRYEAKAKLEGRVPAYFIFRRV